MSQGFLSSAIAMGVLCSGLVAGEAEPAKKADPHGTPEAIRTADNMLLWQRDSGGWPKNIKMSVVLDDAKKSALKKQKSRRDATLDNGATHGQLRHLANVATATNESRFKAGFLKGLDYVLAAQYDNGGFPQVPGGRGYARHITFNDGAMIGVLTVLRGVASGQPPQAFVDAARRKRAARAVTKGIDCILKCQVVVKGQRTAWGQQHDEKTLKPAWARTFEPPSICTGESVGVVRFLMDIDKPSKEVVAAVQGAVAWFDKVRMTGIRQKIVEVKPVKHRYHTSTRDKVLVKDPTAPTLWARLYEIGTNKPIYGDRDRKVHYTLAEISRERRTGYSWLGGYPVKLLSDAYPKWQAKWAPGNNVLAKRKNK